MINSNLNATVRINNVDIKKKSLFDEFSSTEKSEMIASLQYIGSDFQTFVVSFRKDYTQICSK